MLTRGYRVVRPPWGRRPRRHSAAKSRERRRPRSMPWWYRCPRAYVGATHPAKLSAPSPSPQHVAVVPLSSCLCRCSISREAAGPVAIPATCRGGIAVLMPHLYRHPAKLPAPQGSHYSIAAGERSEPAEGGPHHHRPQGGRTPYVGVLRRHPSSGSSPPPAAVAGCAERMSVRPPWGRTYICVALRPRVRHAHPRL